MRTDEEGNPCPETLGEYRDLCVTFGRRLGVPDNDAVKLLDERIARDGRDEVVIESDSQMRFLLVPLLARRDGRQVATNPFPGGG